MHSTFQDNLESAEQQKPKIRIPLGSPLLKAREVSVYQPSRAFPLLATSGNAEQQKARKGAIFWHHIGTRLSISGGLSLPPPWFTRHPCRPSRPSGAAMPCGGGGLMWVFAIFEVEILIEVHDGLILHEKRCFTLYVSCFRRAHPNDPHLRASRHLRHKRQRVHG